MTVINIIAKCWPTNSVHRKIFGILSTPVRHFWEKDIRAGRRPPEKISNLELIKIGLKEIKGEIKLWKKEVTEKFLDDPRYYMPGETNIIWTFDNQADVDSWISTSDKDNNEGMSECNFTLTKDRRGLFSGVLNSKVPKDGIVKRAGYCNIRSLRVRKSFKRESYLNWEMFTHLALRVRGDGRAYLLNISTAGFFDVLWYDVYHYVLFTRGGPYWQDVKIPFSKFILSSKGRVQDKQERIPLNRIASFGISCVDRINGPFNLEIDYIGVYFDGNFKEKFAYETYKLPPYIVGS